MNNNEVKNDALCLCNKQNFSPACCDGGGCEMFSAVDGYKKLV